MNDLSKHSSRESLLEAIKQAEHWANFWWVEATKEHERTGKSYANGMYKMSRDSRDWAARFRGEMVKVTDSIQRKK